jgi:hypothetical protein
MAVPGVLAGNASTSFIARSAKSLVRALSSA